MYCPGDLRAKSLELFQDRIRRGGPVERGLGLVVGDHEQLDFGDQLLDAGEALPRRIERWVMIPNQRSTWFNQEA